MIIFLFQAEDGIRDGHVTGVQTCALPILYDQLQEIAETVFIGVDTENYMDSFTENVTTIGEMFGKESEVEDALAEIDDTIASVDRKSTRLNSSHVAISYAVFCLKQKKNIT